MGQPRLVQVSGKGRLEHRMQVLNQLGVDLDKIEVDFEGSAITVGALQQRVGADALTADETGRLKLFTDAAKQRLCENVLTCKSVRALPPTAAHLQAKLACHPSMFFPRLQSSSSFYEKSMSCNMLLCSKTEDTPTLLKCQVGRQRLYTSSSQMHKYSR